MALKLEDLVGKLEDLGCAGAQSSTAWSPLTLRRQGRRRDRRCRVSPGRCAGCHRHPVPCAREGGTATPSWITLPCTHALQLCAAEGRDPAGHVANENAMLTFAHARGARRGAAMRMCTRALISNAHWQAIGVIPLPATSSRACLVRSCRSRCECLRSPNAPQTSWPPMCRPRACYRATSSVHRKRWGASHLCPRAAARIHEHVHRPRRNAAPSSSGRLTWPARQGCAHAARLAPCAPFRLTPPTCLPAYSTQQARRWRLSKCLPCWPQSPSDCKCVRTRPATDSRPHISSM